MGRELNRCDYKGQEVLVAIMKQLAPPAPTAPYLPSRPYCALYNISGIDSKYRIHSSADHDVADGCSAVRNA